MYGKYGYKYRRNRYKTRRFARRTARRQSYRGRRNYRRW